MDLTPTIVAKSDQLNADDLIGGPVTVTIVDVTKGTTDQPVNIVTEEFGPKRPYKPAKSMRRVMVAAWGADTSTYPGRRLTLFRDPHVKWAGEEVGGIRIAAMSHLAAPMQIALTVAKGKRTPTVVQPLETSPAPAPVGVSDDVAGDWVATINAAESLQELQTIWRDADKQGVARDPRIQEAKDERKAELLGVEP